MSRQRQMYDSIRFISFLVLRPDPPDKIQFIDTIMIGRYNIL